MITVHVLAFYIAVQW